MINILPALLVATWLRSMGRTHKVVAFMVKVRLVENRVKRKVGMVMVVKVITQ